MSGIDLLLSRYFASEIKRKLNEKILSKVERDLFFQHGMSIKLSIEHFENFHGVLRHYYDKDLKDFESECLNKIIQVRRSQNDFELELISSRLSEMVFDYFGDTECRKILLAIMDKPLTVPEILSFSGVLKSPAYRKIENLLLDGMILESGKILTNNKRVSQYRCIFDHITLVIEKGGYIIRGRVYGKYFKQSSLYKLGLFED